MRAAFFLLAFLQCPNHYLRQTYVGRCGLKAGFSCCYGTARADLPRRRRLRSFLKDGVVLNRTWIMCLSPMETTWTRDRRAREIVSQFHSLALASVVLTRDRFRALARYALHDLHFPIHQPP
jgi:hypothetical protein